MYQLKHNFIQDFCYIKIEGNYIDLIKIPTQKKPIDAEQEKKNKSDDS